MEEVIKKLIQQFGLPPVIGLFILLVVILIGWAFRNNLWGFKDKFYKFTKRPPSPGTPRPELKITLSPYDSKMTFKAGKQFNFTYSSLIVENTGEETATEYLSHLSIKDENGVVLFDNIKAIKGTKIAGELLPRQDAGWNLFNFLEEKCPQFREQLQIYGIKATLNRKFTVNIFCTYKAPDGIRSFSTPKYEFRFHWYPEIGSDNIKLKIDKSVAVRPRK